MDKMNTQEMISALVDGQLRGEAFGRGVEAAATEPLARSAWQTYHLVGDVLRSGELAMGTSPATFLAGFQARLQSELQSGTGPEGAINYIAIGDLPEPAAAGFELKPGVRAEAANDGNFRWKLVAGLASLAAVVAIGWGVVGGFPEPQQGQLARAAAPGPAAATNAQVMIRDPRLDELLAAHRQFGADASALQTPAGFLRNATFEGPAR
jgi:sigma-E factor negative regulatory protein RseA